MGWGKLTERGSIEYREVIIQVLQSLSNMAALRSIPFLPVTPHPCHVGKSKKLKFLQDELW